MRRPTAPPLPTLHREARRKAADLLADLMCGRITNLEYMHRSDALDVEHPELREDRVTFAAHGACWWGAPKAPEHTVCVPLQTWDEMTRVLAFLESDLVQVETPGPSRSPCGPLALAIMLAGIAGAAAVASVLLDGLWAFVVIWASVFPITTVVGNLFGRRPHPDFVLGGPFRPFNDEEQWRAHRHLLARFGLPEFDPNVQGRPLPRRVTTWRERVFDVAMSIPAVVLLGALATLYGPINLAGWFAPRQTSEVRAERGEPGCPPAEC